MLLTDRHYNWLFKKQKKKHKNNGVHVKMTNSSVRLHKDLVLNCMTVQMAGYQLFAIH